MEIDFAPSHNPTLFGSLSVSPPASMFDSFSPLLHLNDDFLDVLNVNNDNEDDDVEDWLKPLLFDQLLEHDLQQNFPSINDIDIKEETQENEKLNNNTINLQDKFKITNNYSLPQSTTRKNDFIDIINQRSSEQQLPPSSTTTATVRLIHQSKIEPTELPTALFVSSNELQFHPIVTSNNSGKTIGHTYTSK